MNKQRNVQKVKRRVNRNKNKNKNQTINNYYVTEEKNEQLAEIMHINRILTMEDFKKIKTELSEIKESLKDLSDNKSKQNNIGNSPFIFSIPKPISSKSSSLSTSSTTSSAPKKELNLSDKFTLLNILTKKLKKNKKEPEKETLTEEDDLSDIEKDEDIDIKSNFNLDKYLDAKLKKTKDEKIIITEINSKVDTIDDLIELGKTYSPTKRYHVNMKVLNDLIKPLNKLKKLIGMESVKKNVVNQIIYFLQNLDKENPMMHTVIEGPPGVGKSELAKILAKVYLKMGMLKKDVVKIVKRTDLIGEHLGSTAIKTQEAIDDAEGGVLLIDEAYSLGNEEKKDIFSKECIDTLTANLTEKKDKFICIIAGYHDALEKCFFSYNEGLKRRFTFKYTIDGYSADEIKEIFIKKVIDIKWKINIESKQLTEFFNNNKSSFSKFGGDVETLLIKTKMAHAKRIFGKDMALRRILSYEDLLLGFEMFLTCKEEKENKEYLSMYN